MTDEGTTGKGTIVLLLSLLDRGARWRLVIAAVVSAALALFETAAIVTVLPLVGIATGASIDEGAIGAVRHLLGDPGRTELGVVLVVAVVAIFVLKDVFGMAFSWWQSGFLARERVGMSTEIFRGFMDEPFADFRHRNIGEAMRTMGAAVGQVFSTLGALLTIISTSLTTLAILAALLLTTPVQALLAVVYFGLAALAYLRIVRPRIGAVGTDLMEGSKESTIAAMQGLQGFKEVTLRGSASFFVDRYARGMWTTEQAGRAGSFLSSITRYLLEILFILGVGALLLQSFLSGAAAEGVGALALFVAAGFRLLPNISGLVSSVNSFRMGQASIALVARERRSSARTARDRAAAEVTTDPLDVPTTVERAVALEQVRFRYRDASTEVLRGIDLVLPRGESLAVVGSSGAGKTTLVDMVLGLLEPSAGRLLVDGVDVAGHRRSWQGLCAMVAQEVFIAEDTVRKNILFDVTPREADEELLRDVVRKAQLEDVVEQLPGGLDGDVGDWGSRLSGGQRQRIGIARALYRRPQLLVLDEATSALDNETERRITDVVRALHGETTVIVVAHRLSTVKHVDRVAFLEEGRVTGIGSFEELRRTHPRFAHLVRLGSLEDPGPEPGRPAPGELE